MNLFGTFRLPKKATGVIEKGDEGRWPFVEQHVLTKQTRQRRELVQSAGSHDDGGNDGLAAPEQTDATVVSVAEEIASSVFRHLDVARCNSHKQLHGLALITGR